MSCHVDPVGPLGCFRPFQASGFGGSQTHELVEYSLKWTESTNIYHKPAFFITSMAVNNETKIQ